MKLIQARELNGLNRQFKARKHFYERSNDGLHFKV